jgi:hypothetical protein
MSNGDHVRKSHIHRIYQDDDQNSDTWIDIERIDEIWTTEKQNFPWIEKHWIFDWDSFDPDVTDGSVTKKEVHDPNAKTSTIKVPVRNQVLVETGKGFKWRQFRHIFVNTPENNTRTVHARKVLHYDVPDASLDDNKQPFRNPDDYLGSLGSVDKDQYVRAEVLDSYLTEEATGAAWQSKKWAVNSDDDSLLKDPLKDDGGGAGGVPGIDDDNGAGDMDPPWRLDPLQNIVNVNWGGGLAVEFGDKDQDAPKPNKGAA